MTRSTMRAALPLLLAPFTLVAQRPQPPMPGMPPGTPGAMVVAVPNEGAPAGAAAFTFVTARQGGRARPDGSPRQAGVTRLLNLRRQLDLTPRQVAQFDSIERLVVAEQRAVMERMRAERGGRPPVGQGRMSPDSMRSGMPRLQPQMAQLRQRDSVTTAAAERLLTDAQRGTLRELRAFARGRAAGLRQRDMRGRMRGSMRGGMPGMGPMGQMPPMAPMMPMPPMPPMPPGRDGEEVDVQVWRQGPPGGEAEVRIERRRQRPPR